MLSNVALVPWSWVVTEPIHSEPSRLLWGGGTRLSQSPQAQSQLSLFPSLQYFHHVPSLQDCRRCSCLCFRWWRPCPSCPWRTVSRWVSPQACWMRLSISHASADWTNPSLGLRTWLASRVLNITTQSVCGGYLFYWLVFPFSANEKIEDINGCPKNRSQMVSGTQAREDWSYVSPASEWYWPSWKHSHH